ncbi:MAG: sulfotransferase, partial [Streptosporangiaceae bacterium]
STLPRVIYLGGLGRSGTTLLERLLAELPGVCSAGEVVHMWQRGIVDGELCGCGEPFASCPFWAKVGEVAFGGWQQVDVGRVLALRNAVDRSRHIPLLAAPALPASVRRSLDEYLGYYQRVYSAIAEVSDCPYVVDSSKHASLAFCLRWRRDLDLRVVHVVRDSRAVAYSWTRQVSRPDSAADSYMTRYSPSTAAGLWNAQNGALALLAAEGVPTLRVRYEDLVAEPAATMRAIAAFAGIPAAAADLSFLAGDADGHWADLAAVHTASGNPMRFATGRVPIKRDERWRTAMPAGQRRAVTALTLPLLARYGYTGRAA